MLTSCFQESPAHFRNYINVNASIHNVQTRAANATWTADDAIGIYMKKAGTMLSASPLSQNVKYVTDGTSVFAPVNEGICFPIDGSDVDFVAYYPFQSTINNFVYPVDVSDQSNLPAIDLLYSDNAAALNSGNADVNLNFVHRLSKVTVNLKHEDASFNLTGAAVKITGAGTLADFNLEDGSLSEPQATGDVAFKVSADGSTAQAILLPVADLTGKSLVVSTASNVYAFPLDEGLSITSFEKSTQYTYNITLSTGTIATYGAAIADWTSGPSEDVEVESTGTPPATGGTFENPYTIEEAVANQGLMDKWVKGFIVGYYRTNTYRSFTTDIDEETSSSNIALAALVTETDSTKTFPVQLSVDEVKVLLNLHDHPENIGKEVLVRGDLEKYDYIDGLKSADGVVIDGNTIR